MYYKPPKNRFLKILSNRGFIAANAVAIAGAILLLFFPHGNSWDEYILAFGAEFALPVGFIWLVLGRSLKEYGFGWGKRGVFRNGIILFSSLGIFLMAAWFFLSGTNLGKEFVFAAGKSIVGIRTSFPAFLLYTAFSLWFVVLSEFFFRGFFLFTWKEIFGKMALLAHAVFCGIFIILKVHGLPPEAFGGALLLFGIWSFIASVVAFSTESVFLAFCFSILSDILTTVFVIALS